MKKTSALPLSKESLAQLLELRQQGQSFEVLAAKMPCSPATLWKAALMQPISRPLRLLIEMRLRELVAVPAQPLTAA